MWSGLHTPTSGAQKSVFQNVMGNTTAVCSQCHGQHVREAIGRAQYDVEGPPSRRGTYMAYRTRCGTYMASLRVPGFQRDAAYTTLHALRQRHSLNRYFDSFVPSRRHRPQGLLNNFEKIDFDFGMPDPHPMDFTRCLHKLTGRVLHTLLKHKA